MAPPLGSHVAKCSWTCVTSLIVHGFEIGLGDDTYHLPTTWACCSADTWRCEGPVGVFEPHVTCQSDFEAARREEAYSSLGASLSLEFLPPHPPHPTRPHFKAILTTLFEKDRRLSSESSGNVFLEYAS